jgi:hypothetical protein
VRVGANDREDRIKLAGYMLRAPLSGDLHVHKPKLRVHVQGHFTELPNFCDYHFILL